MLCSVEWLSVTEVSEQPIGPIFKGKVLYCLNPDFVKIRWSRCRSIRTDGRHDVISRMFRDKKKGLFSVVQVYKSRTSSFGSSVPHSLSINEGKRNLVF